MKQTKLKGGSLSSTWLIEENDGTKFVRKECSITENREYGYNRWYSQLKRQQRYNVLFPGLFPKILKMGVDKNMAYFTMEYIEGSVTAFEYLCGESDINKIEKFCEKLIHKMGEMHAFTLPSNPEIMALYLEEEVARKWLDAGCDRIITEDNVFRSTLGNIPAFDLTWFFREMRKYEETTENFTHGNLTLENILYVPKTGRIVFIDPYEENVIDSRLCDYSQILQSSRSWYEIYNSREESVVDGVLDFNIIVPFGIDAFNAMFFNELRSELKPEQLRMVLLFEISQFIRMLPFKKEIDSQKMVFFYAYASWMFEQLKRSSL